MAGTATMICGGCGRTADWNPWGCCSWECFDQDRATAAEQQAMIDDAPTAFAYYMGLAPGIRVDDDGAP